MNSCLNFGFRSKESYFYMTVTIFYKFIERQKISLVQVSDTIRYHHKKNSWKLFILWRKLATIYPAHWFPFSVAVVGAIIFTTGKCREKIPSHIFFFIASTASTFIIRIQSVKVWIKCALSIILIFLRKVNLARFSVSFALCANWNKKDLKYIVFPCEHVSKHENDCMWPILLRCKLFKNV